MQRGSLEGEEMNKKQNEQTKGGAEERILKAALKLFSAQGYEGTTTREIVQEAGSSLSMLNLHYGSKEKLYDKVLERVFEVFYFSKLPFYMEILDARKEHPEDRELNRELLRRYIDMIADTVLDPKNREVVLILNREFLNQAQDLRKIEPMLMLFMNMELLLQSCAGCRKSTAWTREFSFQLVLSMFSHVNYPGVAEFLSMDKGEDSGQTRALVKEYHNLSVDAVLLKYAEKSDNFS